MIELTSIECNICHNWNFSDKWFKFQPDVCNGCHDVLMISANLNDIATLNICGIDYRCVINRISKNDAVKLLQHANLTDERGVL